ncbi:MAG: alpha/beta hydrolase [Steroidobacteraceae bacterium]|jgi:3-oxoadipate enol-lactonase
MPAGVPSTNSLHYRQRGVGSMANVECAELEFGYADAPTALHSADILERENEFLAQMTCKPLMTIFHHADRQLHYLERGRGQPVLLIHGLGSSGADWAMQVRALESRFRVIVPDLPGCGYSSAHRDACSIENFAASLWALLDHLEIATTNIVGFSLGGAVALEMALQRPDSVPRLGLINSLTSYRLDTLNKWLEAWIPSLLIHVFGMKVLGWLCAARLFPQPWQRSLRHRAAAVIGATDALSYLDIIGALVRWTAVDRLAQLRSRVLVLAAEHDLTPLAQKHELASELGAAIVVVRGSRHGTPFDAAEATNTCIFALLSDQPFPPSDRVACDEPQPTQALEFVGSLAEQHALGP